MTQLYNKGRGEKLWGPPWVMERGGLESYGQRQISLNSRIRKIAFSSAKKEENSFFFNFFQIIGFQKTKKLNKSIFFLHLKIKFKLIFLRFLINGLKFFVLQKKYG